MSLAQILQLPERAVLLLVGPPGAGKSAFCSQAVLNSLALERPVIYVTTERGAADLVGLLRDRGLGERVPPALRFVDAFSQTVGVTAPERPDTVYANCMDLNSISIAITRLQERMGQKGILLAFDSLTSPYLFSGAEVIRFMRLLLSRFAAEGNSVVALIDAGCGKPEDLVAMMSIADGVIEMGVEQGARVLAVVKHPVLEPSSVQLPTDRTWQARALDASLWDPEWMKPAAESLQHGEIGGQLESRIMVNLFWPSLMRWSGMLWDPRRFAVMTYEVWKAYGATMRDMIPFFPWYARLFLQLCIPKSFSTVKDMKRLARFMGRMFTARRDGTLEYLSGTSRRDEHIFRVYESTGCWGFEDIGTTMATMFPPALAGMCKGLERVERDWNAVETRCIGLGDPYCEYKVVPGEIPELRDSLQKDPTDLERIYQRLIQRLMAFLIDGRPLVQGRGLGTGFAMGGNVLPWAGGERYRMALRLGGAKVGKEAGERLLEAGVEADEALRRIVGFLEHCQVGRIRAGETIRIWDNRESVWTELLTAKWEEPGCFFTTGFLNGFFSAVKNQHVREIKCIAMGDPYCEWEIL